MVPVVLAAVGLPVVFLVDDVADRVEVDLADVILLVAVRVVSPGLVDNLAADLGVVVPPVCTVRRALVIRFCRIRESRIVVSSSSFALDDPNGHLCC